MKKTSMILTVIPTKVSAIRQITEIFYNSKPGSMTRKKLIQQVSADLDQLMPITYHEWINTCTSNIDDEEFMEFFLEKVSGSVKATLEQWWMAYDLAEYSPRLRKFVLGKMIEIKDGKSWEQIYSKYDLEDDLDNELYLAAEKMLTELGYYNQDDNYKVTRPDYVDNSQIAGYLSEKEELSGSDDN